MLTQYARPFKSCVDLKDNRALALSAARQRLQKIQNKGADNHFDLIENGFFAISRLRTTALITSIFLYTVLNTFAKALMRNL